jgi:serine/threonine protein phosphatase 1
LRRFVFGDIHGQFDGLMQLVDLICPRRGDLLYFLGDLIDRGAKSADVISWVIRYGNGCLKGNHEQMCIEAHNPAQHSLIRQGWLANGGIKTLESYGEKGLPVRHLDWMRNLPLYLDLGDFWLVHAGVDPNKPLTKQTAAEFCWIRTPFHNSQAPFFSDKTIITGHTITFVFPGVAAGHVVIGKGWIDIDTGGYHNKSGWLTALELNSSTVYQVNVFSKAERIMSLDQAAVCLIPDPDFLTESK